MPKRIFQIGERGAGHLLKSIEWGGEGQGLDAVMGAGARERVCMLFCAARGPDK